VFEILKTNITNIKLTQPINYSDWEFQTCQLTQFDREGYELLPIEQEYYKANGITLHREDVLAHESGQTQAWFARSCPWITQVQKHPNLYLDHAIVVSRPSFEGEALKQLKHQAQYRPELLKLINTRAKWGHDFCLDWIDEHSVTEVIHWEWDFLDFNDFQNHRLQMENLIQNTNWISHSHDVIKKYQNHKTETSEELGDAKAAELGLQKAFRLYKTL
jgi:hypothetical protein